VIIIIPICIIIGLVIGYLYSNNLAMRDIYEKETIINEQINELANKDEEIGLLERQNIRINQTLEEKVDEINSLYSNMTRIKEEIQNITQVNADLEKTFDEYDSEIRDLNWEVIRLKSRLGDRLNWKKYSRHDISFEYPDDMELSIVDEGYDMGSVININWIDPVNYFYYSWINMDYFDPELTVENVTSEHSELTFDRKDVIETRVNGHEAYLYYFTISVGDGFYHGIICVWNCEVTNRINVLFQYSSGDPLTTFFQVLSTVECHTTGESI
jgi:uncharacterized protein YneF (UPF0154 family)